jgi:Ulp1 family protease
MDEQQAITQKRLRREILKLKTYLTEPTTQPTLLERRSIRIPQQVVQSSLLQPPALPLQDAQPQPHSFFVLAVLDYDRKQNELLLNSCMEYWLSEHDKQVIKRIYSIDINVRDFKTLIACHRICDNIIDCHMEMLQNAMNHPLERQLMKSFQKMGMVSVSDINIPVLVFSSQFMLCIYAAMDENPYRESYQHTRWLPDHNIKLVSVLLIPICKNDHWVLIVVHPQSHTIELYDSLGSNPDCYFVPLQSWLTERLEEDCSGWTCTFVDCLSELTGRQQQEPIGDVHNCGCYLIYNARKAVGILNNSERQWGHCSREELAKDILRGQLSF